MTKRKRYTAAFKAKVVLELLREEMPLAQVAAQYEVHPSQLRKWKQMTVQCQLLGVSRSSLHYRPQAVSPEEVALKHRIDEIYTDCPFYGSRRLTAQLRREGHKINQKGKRVQRYMREMGIYAICTGPNLSSRAQESQVFPYLCGVWRSCILTKWGAAVGTANNPLNPKPGYQDES